MFIKFEGRIFNTRQIKFIEKQDTNNESRHIDIHFLSKERLRISYTNTESRNLSYEVFEKLLVK